nr:DUF3999 domain-containing protein [uncultured Desulfobulbus sp.]
MPCKKILHALALIMLLWSPVCAWSKSLAPKDFAYGARLQITDPTGLYGARLPLSIYQKLQQDDQGDLQVFNAAGQPVPQLLRRQSASPEPLRQAVPFFPLPIEQHTPSPDLAIRVQRNSDGSIITVDSGKGARYPDTSGSFLLDLSKTTPPPSALELAWEAVGANEMISLRVCASRDLSSWGILRDRVVLAELHYNGGTVSRRSFPLPAASAPYLRIDCRDCQQPLNLSTVTAISGARPERDQFQWQPLTDGQIGKEKGWWRVEYHNPSRFRVTALDLTFPLANSLARVSIESRNSSTEAWKKVGSGDFYRLDLQGSTFTSAVLPCVATSDRYWRMTIGESQALSDQSQLPRLSLGWHPDTLLFLGRGPGPYTLAFGKADMEHGGAVRDPLLEKILEHNGSDAHLIAIEPGAISALAGEQALQPNKPPLPWKRILLWAVLIAGVGLLALMVRSVFREMQRKQG